MSMFRAALRAVSFGLALGSPAVAGAATLALSDPARFRAAVDGFAGTPLAQIAPARLERFEGTVFRLVLDPQTAPYVRWAAGAGQAYPGYFGFDPVAGTVRLRLAFSAVGLDVFNYEATAPTFGAAYEGLAPLALFARETRRIRRHRQNPHDRPIRVAHSEWDSYYVAFEPVKALHQQVFRLPPERRAGLSQLRVVLEFRPAVLPGARRLVGRQEFSTTPSAVRPRSSHQRWHYLSVRPLAIHVIDARTRELIHSAPLAP